MRMKPKLLLEVPDLNSKKTWVGLDRSRDPFFPLEDWFSLDPGPLDIASTRPKVPCPG